MSGDVTLGALARIKLAGGVNSKYAVNASTTAFTATAAEISGGFESYLNLTGVLAAGRAITLPTVAALMQGLKNAAPGQTYTLRIINSSSGAFAWTVTTNTGWTLNGTMTIAQNTWRDFVVTIGAGNTATLQAVGTGTQS